MIHSHARCDRCEKNLIPLGDEGVTEDYLLDAGWVCVKWVEPGDEEPLDVTKDFCSFVCASKWCADEVAGLHRRTDERADQR